MNKHTTFTNILIKYYLKCSNNNIYEISIAKLSYKLMNHKTK